MRKLETTSHMGAHAESQFISFALESGWEVAHPFLKAVAYDSLIRRDPKERWETVQIKRAYYATKTNMKNRHLEVGLRRRSGVGSKLHAYKEGDFDWLFCYHEDGRWFMPWDLIKGRRSSMLIGSSRYDLWKV